MRAQIKMFETVGILVVFFFLLATSSAFYFGAQKSALQKEKMKASEQLAFNIALKSLYLPELDCSFLVTQKDNCIDKIKLVKFSELLKTPDAQTDYFGVFGFATIKISEAYPAKSTTLLYENIPSSYAGSLQSLNPILLFDPWRDEYAFGIIEVTVYVQ
ncbi:MAG TPA: hypothetical protein VI612_04190 [Candidatus Nanoarchaeia archaeon]|nr:hypothetical protein [Candidatus Nanoarchaeia archaeon]